MLISVYALYNILPIFGIKKMKAKLKIKEAIEFYNKNRNEGQEELTAASLALKVFHDKNSKDICKIKLFSGIMNNRRRFVDLKWLVTISEATGYPAKELIDFT